MDSTELRAQIEKLNCRVEKILDCVRQVEIAGADMSPVFTVAIAKLSQVNQELRVIEALSGLDLGADCLVAQCQKLSALLPKHS